MVRCNLSFFDISPHIHNDLCSAINFLVIYDRRLMLRATEICAIINHRLCGFIVEKRFFIWHQSHVKSKDYELALAQEPHYHLHNRRDVSSPQSTENARIGSNHWTIYSIESSYDSSSSTTKQWSLKGSQITKRGLLNSIKRTKILFQVVIRETRKESSSDFGIDLRLIENKIKVSLGKVWSGLWVDCEL